MTEMKFREIMICNEPEFDYMGEHYSICSPDGKYYVTSSDRQEDIDLEFDTLDSLMDDWIIQGKSLRDILPFIEI